MEFNVAQLLKATVGDSRVYDVNEDIGSLDETPTKAPITGVVRLVRMPRTILVEANLKTVVVLSCSRCLEEMVQPVTIKFTEEYEPSIDINTGLAIETEDDDDRFRIDENHVLDLTEAVREYGLLALPMQPICRVDCKGLCPKCGQNRNSVECGCSSGITDGRLAKLQELLEEDK